MEEMSKLKLNIGSGFKRFDGFLNVDDDPGVNPDYCVTLDDPNLVLPFEDDSVDGVIAHHILEHIGTGYIRLMQELYRVCCHGALIDIRVPHHFHEIFINDPTHKRPITVEGMRLFSKRYMDESIRSMGSSNGMAYKYHVDFEIVKFDYVHDSFYAGMLEDFRKRQTEERTTPEEEFAIQRLFREANNTTLETLMVIVAVKEPT
jgi:predicted SAM-dependent methyltransferase